MLFLKLIPGSFSDWLLYYIEQFEFKLKKKIIGIQKLAGKVRKMALTFLNRQLLVVMQAFVQLLLVVFWGFFCNSFNNRLH